MTHSIGYLNPNPTLALRTNRGNPNHHLWNNNGTWYVHYTIAEEGRSGERQRKSLGTKYLLEARRRRNRLFASLKGGVR